MRKLLIGLACTMAAAQAPAQVLRADQADYRAILKEMVETDTSITTGSCTALADKVAARLKAAGFPDADVVQFAGPDHPKEGGVVAVLPGTSRTLRPILLMGHIDVVAAKREDWTRDPYAFIEEGGYYYGRGVADMKAMDAVWLDTMIRLKKAGTAPKRTIRMALTCGEETTWAFNGIQWLADNRPELIDAAFALNEGGGGRSDGRGRLEVEGLQVGEKAVQNYRLEVTNPGGHSSIPVPDNAIYHLARGLAKLADHEFPVEFTDTTRAYFTRMAAVRKDETGRAMAALVADPQDKAAEAVLNRDRTLHAMLRTTCVATLLEAGHANNALPQRAAANVNCRIFPGHSVEETQATIARVVGDDQIRVTLVQPVRPVAVPPPLDPAVVKPAETLAAKYFPGVPLIPTMLVGATDAVFVGKLKMPVYGAPGAWFDPDGNGVHGLNERIEVKAALTGRDYLYDLVRAYAG